MSANRPEPLNRERILRAALELIEREGLERLSMRKLGAALGVEAMALYHHIPSKEALLDGVVELLAGEVEIPGEEVGGWADRIGEVTRRYRRLAHVYPNAFPLIALRPLNTPGALRPIEAALEIVRSAGVDGKTAVRIFHVLASYASGYALSELVGFGLESERPARSERLTPEKLPLEEFPRIREVAPHFAEIDHDGEFEFGLDLILSALVARVDTKGRTAATAAGIAFAHAEGGRSRRATRRA